MTDRIPSHVIGVLGEVFNAHYTHAEIDRMFAYADAPDHHFSGNKVSKTVEWLRLTNKVSNEPLKVLGFVIEELMEKEGFDPSSLRPWQDDTEPEWSQQLRARQDKVRKALARAGLSYSHGGHIVSGAASPSESLQEMVQKGGLAAINQEMKRALEKVETDPNAAAHYAANALEAAFKTYLTKKGITYKEDGDTLNDLWQKTRDDIGINPKNLGSKDLKKIASGLNSIVDGTMFLRNKKSGAHGKTDEQLKEAAIKPRHARLVIHASHTLAAYVLEFLE